jgi:hypothetical protein
VHLAQHLARLGEVVDGDDAQARVEGGVGELDDRLPVEVGLVRVRVRARARARARVRIRLGLG